MSNPIYKKGDFLVEKTWGLYIIMILDVRLGKWKEYRIRDVTGLIFEYYRLCSYVESNYRKLTEEEKAKLL